MIDHWEILDIYKALLAIAAGIILGLEREMKDKAAGLKTITIICLGATLFSIISYKVGGSGNNTAIAAYIVSGVGFIGAGAIFKDGLTISGLTTAGIIWLAAAVGTAIGFGEFYLAATFIVASLIIITITPLINKIFRTKTMSRNLLLVVQKENLAIAAGLLNDLRSIGVIIDEKKITYEQGLVEVASDISMPLTLQDRIKDMLLNEPAIIFLLYSKFY